MKLNEQIKDIPIFHKGKRIGIIPALSHAEAKKEWIRMHPEFKEHEIHTMLHKESMDENIIKKVWNDIKPEPGEKLRDVVKHFNPVPTSKEGIKQAIHDTLRAGKKVLDVTTNPVKTAKKNIKENAEELEKEHIKHLLADKHDLNVKHIYGHKIVVNNAQDDKQIRQAHKTLERAGYPHTIWIESHAGEDWNKDKPRKAGMFAGD